jgi:hypothetical protein
MTPLRLTWVQPEDLLGHELHQAKEDGREPSAIAARWHRAGGPQSPQRAGASPQPASPYLRALAQDLLDELADLPSRLESKEPTALRKIKALCPNWPTAVGTADLSRSSGGLGAAPPPVSGRGGSGEEEPALTPTTLHPRLEAAWLGRAAGCLLGKPVEKLPLDGIRQLAQATGNWPLTTWFTERGLPPHLKATHPWNRRSATTSLAENIDGMPEDDDLNYPLLNLLLLQRHGKHFTTTDVARLWLDELPAGRTFTAERVAYRNLLGRHRAPANGPPPQPVPRMDRRPDPRGRPRLDQPRRPGDRRGTGPPGRHPHPHRQRRLRGDVHGGGHRRGGHRHERHPRLPAYGPHRRPPDSRLAEAVRHAIQLAAEHRDFDTVVDELHATHATYHWVHAIPNTALLAAALTHADGDFTASICRVVSGGWDTDSNGATAGSITGLLAGAPEAIPSRWTTPLKNRLATSIGDFNGTGFDTLADLTAQLATRPTT